MPYKPPHPCGHGGCPALTHGRYCEAHTKPQPRPLDGRPREYFKPYGYAWQQLRAKYIKAHPLCEVCGAPAKDVDHIVPVQEGGPSVWSNLQSLCRSCHNRKTQRGQRATRGTGSDRTDSAYRTRASTSSRPARFERAFTPRRPR